MIKRNLFYNAILSVSQFIFPLITFPYSSRILGPKGMGSINFIDSFTQYFLLFSALGIPLYGVREIAKYRNDSAKLEQTFNNILFIHIGSTAIFIIIYLAMALAIPELRLHMPMVLVGVAIMVSNVFTIEWFFQGMEQFSYITLRSLILRTISVIFLFVFLKPKSEPVTYYLILASGFYMTSILNFIVIRRHVKIKYCGLNLKEHFKPLLVILSSTLAVSVYLLLDNIILGFMKNETAVGIYSTAVRIIKIPFTLIVAISSVIIPQISLAYRNGNMDQIRVLIHKAFSFICIFGMPIAVGMFISASFLIHKFAGEKFNDAVLAMQILSPVIMLVGLNNIFGFQILTPIGKEKYLLRAVVIGMFVSISTNFLLIPLFSYNGAAIANLLTECVVTFFCYFFAKKSFTFKLEYKIFLQSLAGALVFFGIAYGFRSLHLSYNLTEILIIAVCITFYTAYVIFYLKNPYILSFKTAIANKLTHFKNS